MTKHSPLFWPVSLKGNALYILDETLIPNKVKYIKAKNYLDVVRAIKTMKTRAFGQYLCVLYTFLLEFKKDSSTEHLKKVAVALNKSRPTFPFSDITSLFLKWHAEGKDLTRSIEGMLIDIKNKRLTRANTLASFIPDGATVLTHCNVSGELVEAANFCKKAGKKVKFIATETRPYFQGARLTAWELARAGFDVTLITDNAVAHVMEKGLVNMVVVGSDRSAMNGDFANKIGTFQIAILAKYFNIPFYVLTQHPSPNIKTGKDIPIEIRSGEEITKIKNIRIAPKGIKAYYPGFDVTPRELVTKAVLI
ncbi:MAG: S-methyl-5-thioribose-1-phosphate isomerase [Candidatus Omnitrophota bacterium]